MASKASILKNSLFITLFFMSLSLWAQSGSFIYEQRYTRRFSWKSDQYALRYEVVVERDEGKGYEPYLREFTEMSSFQVTFLPGKYRYCVIPYDLLNQSCEASDWVILNFNPSPVIPLEVIPGDDNNYALHTPERDELVPGINEIIIKNPDELDRKDGVLIVEKPKKIEIEIEEIKEIEKIEVINEIVDMYKEEEVIKPEPPFIVNKFKPDVLFQADWMPVIVSSGEILQYLDRQFFPLGATLRFDFLFKELTGRSIYPGLEFFASWYGLENKQNYDNNLFSFTVFDIFLLLQWRNRTDKLAFNIKMGGGITVQGALNSDTIIPNMSFDSSLLLFMVKKWFTEFGINFSMFFTDEPSVYFRPWIGIGYKF